MLSQADGALKTLASEWKKTFEDFQKNEYPVPPVMIIVCANTFLSELTWEKISSGRIFSELKNEDGKEVTLRIDTRLLDQAESRLEETKEDVAAQTA